MNTVNVGKFSIFADTKQECVNEIYKHIKTKPDKPKWLACMNPHSYAEALKDDEFNRALMESNWLVPDGIGIIYAARIFRNKMKERIAGHDIFSGVNSLLEEDGDKSIFFLGSTLENLDKISEKLKIDYPGLELAGVYSPPFKPEFSDDDVEEMINKINSAAADVVWVGLTAPKQEKLINRMIPYLSTSFLGAVGAVFEFYSGRIKRPNKFYQKLGLEWLVRLIGEPKRLWRRTIVSAPVFIYDLFKCSINNKREGKQHD